ncbi:MAG: helix-hairpin-helix domain-containing protein [Prevotella sp.]|nr:helix-hairpin-helix domain-containing protein [Prevotella sp.]
MIREFFYLQKSDRQVILTLLGVIVVALGVIFLTGGEDETNGLTPADTLRTERYHDTSRHYRDSVRTVYVRTRVVYRDTAFSRGRAFRNPTARDTAVTHYQPKLQEGEHLVLNTADTTQLMTVPGIGPYFARKIVAYGQRLGGYVSVDQLDEIEGFPLDAKAYLVIGDAHPEQLNVNQLSLAALKRHPYINYFQAKAIMDYRRLHGPIRSLDDLRLSKDFPPEAIARLAPYVTY